LVGLSAPDDAAVFKLNDEQAIVATVDFFAPLVDDPYDYGAIAAANAMSDVYAMGGEVVLALNVAAFPESMAPETIARILRGGAEKVSEAGGVIAGGHTVLDDEPKYGLSVLGLVHPERIVTKGGALTGDVLLLTKALGTGIITTAAMRDQASAEHLAAAVESMTTLNRHASHIALESGVHAMTDITGFGLLGHACEMANASGKRVRIVAAAVPTLAGALQYAERGLTTGGAARNIEHFGPRVSMAEDVSAVLRDLLWDPQTSGGLLIALPSDQARDAQRRLKVSGVDTWAIGEVVEGEGVEVVS
jgi:selenide,water dikinase